MIYYVEYSNMRTMNSILLAFATTAGPFEFEHRQWKKTFVYMIHCQIFPYLINSMKIYLLLMTLELNSMFQPSHYVACSIIANGMEFNWKNTCMRRMIDADPAIECRVYVWWKLHNFLAILNINVNVLSLYLAFCKYIWLKHAVLCTRFRI